MTKDLERYLLRNINKLETELKNVTRDKNIAEKALSFYEEKTKKLDEACAILAKFLKLRTSSDGKKGVLQMDYIFEEFNPEEYDKLVDLFVYRYGIEELKNES